jgi:protein TonB
VSLFDPPLHETPRRSVSRWIGIAVLVVGLHAGSAALALWKWPHEDRADEEIGTPMIVELAALPSTPQSDAEEAAAGEPTEAAPATPEVEQKLSAPTETELPTAIASPYRPPPDLEIAQEKTQKESETEEDGQPTEAIQAAPPTPPSAPAAQAAEAAPPSVSEDTLVGSPQEGSAVENAKLQDAWNRAIMTHLGKHKRYPEQARRRHVEGEVMIRFVFDRAGTVLRAEVAKSSGSPLLDEEGIKLMGRASPLPSLPPHMRADQTELVVPIKFRVR